MSEPRTKSISSKMTVNEYLACQQAAGSMAVSSWVHGVILRELERMKRKPAEQLLLEEMWAGFYVLISALPSLVPASTRSAVEAIMTARSEEADHKKASAARGILNGVTP